MSDEEVEALARTLQAEVYPFGPERPSPPWAVLVEVSKNAWRAKARSGVKPGQAKAEAERKKAIEAAGGTPVPPRRR